VTAPADEHQRSSRDGFHHHDSAKDGAGSRELQDEPGRATRKNWSPHPEIVLPTHR